MVRDMELVRHILLAVEAHGASAGAWARIPVGRWSADDVGAHIGLLGQADYLEVSDVRSHDHPNGWQPKRLTWKGHDMVDALRNDTVWQKVKAKLAAFGGDLPLEVVKDMAIAAAKTMVE